MTPAHGHAALFGVYGMLGIGLMLFCLRGLYERSRHADSLPPAFWGLNIGLAMMVFMSLLPAGIYQAWASVTTGLWYARSPEMVHSGVMETLVWLRVPGDIVFSPAPWPAVYALLLLPARRPAAPWSKPAGVRTATTVKLTTFTDYSLRVLIYLAAQPGEARHHRGDRARLRHLGEPPGEGRAPARQERLGGDGARQGWWPRLAMPPARINVGDVVRQAEGPRCLRLVSTPKTTLLDRSGVPSARRVARSGRAFQAVLDRYTLEDLVSNRQVLSRLLFVKRPDRGRSVELDH